MIFSCLWLFFVELNFLFYWYFLLKKDFSTQKLGDLALSGRFIDKKQEGLIYEVLSRQEEGSGWTRLSSVFDWWDF